MNHPEPTSRDAALATSFVVGLFIACFIFFVAAACL